MLTLFCKQIDDARLKSGCVTFNDVLDVWLAETRGRVKRSTLATYGGACERYIRPALGPVPTEQMTDEEVAKFLGEASEIYSSSTLRIICHILRSALELAHDAGLCAAVNGRFQLPHGARHEARILSQEDQLRLLETLRPEDGPVQLGILLCMYTGMRLGEACGLRWGDFSPDCNIICIRRNAPAPRRPRRGAQDRARARHAQELQLHARDTGPRPAAPGARERALRRRLLCPHRHRDADGAAPVPEPLQGRAP